MPFPRRRWLMLYPPLIAITLMLLPPALFLLACHDVTAESSGTPMGLTSISFSSSTGITLHFKDQLPPNCCFHTGTTYIDWQLFPFRHMTRTFVPESQADF